MMVANDQINALFTGKFGLFDSRNSTVYRHNEGGLLIDSVLNSILTDSITFLKAVRNIRRHVGTEPFQKAVYDSRSSGAIDIVITVNNHFFVAPDGRSKPGRRLFHVFHQEGVVKSTQVRTEETAGTVERSNATKREQSRNDSGSIRR